MMSDLIDYTAQRQELQGINEVGSPTNGFRASTPIDKLNFKARKAERTFQIVEPALIPSPTSGAGAFYYQQTSCNNFISR
jgi:hypothetical protein